MRVSVNSFSLGDVSWSTAKIMRLMSYLSINQMDHLIFLVNFKIIKDHPSIKTILSSTQRPAFRSHSITIRSTLTINSLVKLLTYIDVSILSLCSGCRVIGELNKENKHKHQVYIYISICISMALYIQHYVIISLVYT